MQEVSMSRVTALLTTVLLLVAIASVNAEGVHAEMSENASRIRVVVTSLPLLWVVKEVGGNLVSVVDIVPPGTDPHTYEPPPSQLVSMLKNADVVFITGPTHLPVELRIRELAKERAIKAIIVDYEDYVRHGLKVLP